MSFAKQAEHTVLVVEDNVLLRFDIAEYLRECGYHVHEADNAAEAISILAAYPTIDLVFSDIQMPGDLDGFGLARWIRQHRPAIRIILTSGHVGATEASRTLCDDGPIPKPYAHSFIVDRIRENLDI